MPERCTSHAGTRSKRQRPTSTATTVYAYFIYVYIHPVYTFYVYYYSGVRHMGKYTWPFPFSHIHLYRWRAESVDGSGVDNCSGPFVWVGSKYYYIISAYDIRGPRYVSTLRVANRKGRHFTEFYVTITISCIRNAKLITSRHDPRTRLGRNNGW